MIDAKKLDAMQTILDGIHTVKPVEKAWACFSHSHPDYPRQIRLLTVLFKDGTGNVYRAGRPLFVEGLPFEREPCSYLDSVWYEYQEISPRV